MSMHSPRSNTHRRLVALTRPIVIVVAVELLLTLLTPVGRAYICEPRDIPISAFGRG